MKLYECSDPGNAERFRDYWGDKVKYLIQERTWIRFQDSGWYREVSESTALTEPVAKSMFDELKAIPVHELQKLKDYDKHVIKSQSLYEQTKMLRYNRPKDFLGVSIEEFDNQPTLINAMNGIVNLETKELTPHSENQLHLHKAHANYNPDAMCPLWDKAVQDTFSNDPKLIELFRRYIGYSVTGLIREQYLFIAHGPGGNGKDMLLDTIARILGSYALTPDFSLFISKNKSDSRYLEAIGELKGVRFAVSAEPNRGIEFDSALIKKLTGNNRLKGSILNNKAFYFDPTHKLWISANYLPKITDYSKGMWRRPKVIPFTVEFDTTKNTDLKEKLLQERDGIFNRLVEYAYEYLSNGMPDKLPDAVIKATEDYQKANDIVSPFLKEWIMDAHYWEYEYKQDVYNLFKKLNGDGAMSLKDFYENVESRPSFKGMSDKMKHGAIWRGCKLRKGDNATHSGDEGDA